MKVKEIDWTKVSNEERLAECRRRYKEGLVINCLHSVHKNWVVPNSFKIWGEEGIIRIWSNYGTGVCCLYYDGKFAEIVTEEKEKYDFKVGDAPKWTPELIKQLPHGTMLECAYDNEDMAVWNGQKLHYSEREFTTDSFFKFYKDVDEDEPFWLHDEDTGKYAKIISLPKEETMTKEQIRTELINELIEWNDKGTFAQKTFTQRSWTEISNKLESMLPTETPEKIAERKADKMIKERTTLWQKLDSGTVTEIEHNSLKQMLIEALLTDIKK